jgi:hypothetical protein
MLISIKIFDDDYIIDMDESELICIEASKAWRREFSEICIKQRGGYSIGVARIEIPDIESSNNLGNEIVKRWNAYRKEDLA